MVFLACSAVALGGGAQPLDGDQPPRLVGIEAGIAERDMAAQGVSDDGDRRQFLLMDELGEVVDVAGHGVAAVGRPLAVPVAAQIGRDDVPVMAQRLGDPIPVPAMVPAAMKEEQRRRAGVAPIHVVQAQPLGEIDPRGRAGHIGGRCHVGRLHRAAIYSWSGA